MSDEHASEEEANQNGTDNGSSVDGDTDVHERETISDPDAEIADAGVDADADADADAEETDAAPEPTPLEKAIHERDRMKDQLLRIAADFDNFRKRSRREIEDARRRSQQDTILEILPVIDNLERAEQASSAAQDVKAVVDGVRMVIRGFEDVVSRLGITRINVVGEQFDPNLHDAMQQQETNEHSPGTIVAEIVAGYTMHDRLLRPAMVVVAKPPSSASEAPSAASEAPAAGSEPPAEADSPDHDGDDVVFIDDGTDESADQKANGSSRPSSASGTSSEPPKDGEDT